MKKILIAALLSCMPFLSWAGNWSCTVSGLGFQDTGSGENAQLACLEAAKKISVSIVSYVNKSKVNLQSCATYYFPIADNPFPIDDAGTGNNVCTDGSCSTPGGTGVRFTTNNPSVACNPGVTATATQISGGTNWGPQYGSLHSYDSIAGTTPDVVSYIGPQDGNLSIEVEANQGINSTAVTAVTLTNAGGAGVGTVIHTHTNPDVWTISGNVHPLTSYNLNITFSHSGGYGEYAVKMSGVGAKYTFWSPGLFFCDSNGANCTASSSTYGNITAGEYIVIGRTVLAQLCLNTSTFSNGTSNHNTAISLPILASSTVPSSGNGPVTFWSFQNLSSGNGAMTLNVSGAYAYLYTTGTNGVGWVTDSNWKNGSQICGVLQYQY